MKYLIAFILFFSASAFSEDLSIPLPLAIPACKNINFSKLLAFDHVYIVFFEQKEDSELQIKHDPSCPCKKVKEEHLMQIINELLRLQKGVRI